MHDQIYIALGHMLDCEFQPRSRPISFAEHVALRFAVQQLQKCAGQKVRVGRWNKHFTRCGTQCVPHAGKIRCDDRFASRHAFKDSIRHALESRAENRKICCLNQTRRISDKIKKADT